MPPASERAARERGRCARKSRAPGSGSGPGDHLPQRSSSMQQQQQGQHAEATHHAVVARAAPSHYSSGRGGHPGAHPGARVLPISVRPGVEVQEAEVRGRLRVHRVQGEGGGGGLEMRCGLACQQGSRRQRNSYPAAAAQLAAALQAPTRPAAWPSVRLGRGGGEGRNRGETGARARSKGTGGYGPRRLCPQAPKPRACASGRTAGGRG